jgi:very-short-patch-repair endonuclease
MRGQEVSKKSPYILTPHFFFIADFYCHEKKLVVELDGAIHDFQKRKDFNRDKIIQGLSLKVIRFTNQDLIDLDFVWQKIFKCIR